MLTTLLKRAHYDCLGFATARNALAFMSEHEVDLIIADVFMPEMDGFELLRVIHRGFPMMPVITLSGGGSRLSGDFFLDCTERLGAVAALKKPLDVFTLMTLLDRWAPLSDEFDAKNEKTSAARAAIGDVPSDDSTQEKEDA